MSDDLVKRLRNGDTVMANHYMDEAADRIEELEAKLDEEIRTSNMRGNHIEFELLPALHDAEAKLAKAVGALEQYIYETTHLSPQKEDGSHWCKISESCLSKARATRAELKDGAEG